MDAWFEEDEQVHVHPRDPYPRVDVLRSSRHVRVELDGVTVADSRSPRILFETGLVPRFYLPKTDVQVGLLRASDTQTSCPYRATPATTTSKWPARPTPTSFWIGLGLLEARWVGFQAGPGLAPVSVA